MSEQPTSESGLLSQLDTFRFVAAIAFIAAIALVIFSLYLWSKLNDTVDRLDSVVHARLVEAQASDIASVQRCYASATQGPALRAALMGLEKDVDPDTREALRNLRRTSALNTTTIRECRQLAKKLGVNTPKEEIR